jgi:rare lipoprotein A
MKNIQWIALAFVICSAALAGEFLPTGTTRTTGTTVPGAAFFRNAAQSVTPLVPGDSLKAPVTCTLVEGGYSKTGNVSYYADKFHGRRTSSGAVYHRDSLTAAHKTLKFGTLLRVTNLSNDSVVIVKVTDRMGKTSHVMDLSYAGARQLDIVRKGVAKVKIEEITR